MIGHNGFHDKNSADGPNSFLDAGDYPGFVLKTAGEPNGDFNAPDATGPIRGRPPGHGIDIDQDKTHRFIRNPVPGFANNIPAGTVHAFGRIADVPSADNRRFYPDRDLPPILLFDADTGDLGIKVFPFNLADPLQGDPVEETGMGYLMRNAQWLVQVVGADGFRIDAAKHVSHDTLKKFDRAAYRANPRKHLDGSQRQVFSFGETKDRQVDVLKPFIRQSIDPGDPGKIGGNRDTLDFAMFDAVKENLTNNGLANDWRRVRPDSLDTADNGRLDGSAGVKFVSSHDDDGPFLSNVAYAHLLMLPGNAIVYCNASSSPGDFPKPGRGDALGGMLGDRIVRLVDIRTTHGRGNYHERILEKELYAFEREGSNVRLRKIRRQTQPAVGRRRRRVPSKDRRDQTRPGPALPRSLRLPAPGGRWASYYQPLPKSDFHRPLDTSLETEDTAKPLCTNEIRSRCISKGPPINPPTNARGCLEVEGKLKAPKRETLGIPRVSRASGTQKES